GIPLPHDGGAHGSRKRVHLKMSSGPLDLINQAKYMGDRQAAQPYANCLTRLPRRRQGRDQPVKRPILTEKQDFVFAPEIVVEISRREIRRKSDLAHPGSRIAA